MNDPKSLDVRVLRRVHAGLTIDVELTLGRECGVVFGPSGAGKTSLLRLIAGLDTPSSGHVRIDDDVLFDAHRFRTVPLRKRRIGMIFQDDLLFPHLSARDNIGFGLNARSRPEREARTAEVARLCGVEPLLDRRPATLSGGERQRIGLARALAPRPRLLLCDEPVSALDLEARTALIEHLRAVQRAEGIPVLYVTHSPSEAITLGSQLFLLSNGRIIDRGKPLDVLTKAQHGSSARLEGVRNVFTAIVESHAPDGGETTLRLAGGPTLIVPSNGRPVNSIVSVAVRADDILIARGSVKGLSARNRISGIVERVIAHHAEAEVLVRTAESTWIVSVVAAAVSELGLGPGANVELIIKARSCHVLEAFGP